MLNVDLLSGLLNQFLGVNIAGQIGAYQDSFAYTILIWLLVLAGII